jgi:hypothetical protein
LRHDGRPSACEWATSRSRGLGLGGGSGSSTSSSGIVKPAGDAKRAFSDLFNRRTRREQEQEEDRILGRTDKPSFVDTNLRLDEWVLQPFREILREKASGQQRDPKFSETKWAREAVTARQTTGQARLEASLVLYEKHLASLTFLTSVASGAAGGGAAAADDGALAGASALRIYLESLTITGLGPVTLRSECKRRGLKVSGLRSELVERVEEHAIANAGGFRDLAIGDQVPDGKPVGFAGDLPVPSHVEV